MTRSLRAGEENKDRGLQKNELMCIDASSWEPVRKWKYATT